MVLDLAPATIAYPRLALLMIDYLRLVRQLALAFFALGFLGLLALSLPAVLKWSLLAIIAAAWVVVRARQEGHNNRPQGSRPNEDLVVMSEQASSPQSRRPLVPLHQSLCIHAPMAFLQERELWIEKSWRITSMSVSSGTAGGGYQLCKRPRTRKEVAV